MSLKVQSFNWKDKLKKKKTGQETPRIRQITHQIKHCISQLKRKAFEEKGHNQAQNKQVRNCP